MSKLVRICVFHPRGEEPEQDQMNKQTSHKVVQWRMYRVLTTSVLNVVTKLRKQGYPIHFVMSFDNDIDSKAAYDLQLGYDGPALVINDEPVYPQVIV